MDFLTQTHLAAVDKRFKYDAVFALGLVEYYTGLMNSYDKMVGTGEQSTKIWSAFSKSVGMDPDTVKADANAAVEYAKATPPGQILKHLEGAEAPSESRMAEAFSSISSKL